MSTIHVNDTNLYYEVNGAGEPLLFIHGLGSSTRDWEYQVPVFSKTHKVITYDLRGQGRSDKPAGPYPMTLLASDVDALLNALEISAAHVVGVSLGGGIAIECALDFPAHVKSLVIVNSGPAVAPDAEAVRQELDNRVKIVRQMGMRAMGEVLAPRLFPKPEQAARRETFIARWAENEPDGYISAMLSMYGWDVTERLHEIKCPTIVITGDKDYTPVAFKEAYIKRIPNAELVVIPDAHHAMPLEYPEEFNTALAEFLGKQP